jgi:glycosyltransferase involved in cell wall biosynthesis
VKILYHHRVRSKDGQAVHIEELVAALRRRGHEVIVSAPAGSDGAAFGSDAGLVAVLKRRLPLALYELLEFAYSWIAYARLRAAYRRHRPDVLYERYNLYLLAGARLHRRYRLPMVLEVNAPLVEERGSHGGLALPALARWAEGSAWRAADVVAPVTEALADHVRRAGVASDRIVVIPNGIDPARFGPEHDGKAVRARHGLGDRVVLGFTGFMRPWHGLDRVIRFVAEHGARLDLHALLVGDGPVRAELEALARSEGAADRVTFTGLVGRDAIADHVAAFDIAVQPDVVAYASPLKLFEYMGLGRAIVAPDSPNIREVLTDGVDAVLFDAAAPEALQAAILRLCEDDDLRARLGRAARAAIDAKGLTWDRNAERVETLFLGLLARNP